jgi:Mn2+/Fe2+ NRAMP family transporter
MIGATVMPHNLYLHSSLVQSRAVSNTVTAKKEACKFNLIDSTVALNAAFLVNAAILIMAAADFHSRGILVTEIQQAHSLLDGVLGSGWPRSPLPWPCWRPVKVPPSPAPFPDRSSWRGFSTCACVPG